MLKKIAMFVCCALCLVCLGEEFTGRVVAVTDGDTIKVLVEKDGVKTENKVRLWGIDAPESKQPFGYKSKQFLSGLIFQKTVRVVYDGKDQYGRFVGKIYLDGKDINCELIRNGLAWHYVYYARNEQAYADAMKEAQKKHLGIWSQKSVQAPWEFRRERKAKAAEKKKKQ